MDQLDPNEAAFAKRRLTEHRVGCVAAQHNYIAAQEWCLSSVHNVNLDGFERRPGEIALTDIGGDVVRYAERVLASTRDVIDFARHQGRLLATTSPWEPAGSSYDDRKP